MTSSMIYLIYCKNMCKCHNVPTYSTTIKKEKKKNPQASESTIFFLAVLYDGLAHFSQQLVSIKMVTCKSLNPMKAICS
jgi:hypothetical protein